ncbi:uncharacterized protein LOC123562873 [Mercenaria mercenaria]|uniref:uncharacterized protein LOC123562873 n=1 Tax=Mercenaria mercenaria TaxID=6596 RepID=UPI001E1D6C4A|nr:uncharacterized protein LOC123562873 [Mercenaria mercenaria]
MLKMQLYVFLVAVSLSVVYGAVSFTPIMTEEVYGHTVRFCPYKGIRMLPGSKVRNYDSCEICRCKKKGLSCATLPNAFTVHYPDDSKCISVRIGCKNHWVLRKNNKRRCPKRLIPKEISMVGK